MRCILPIQWSGGRCWVGLIGGCDEDECHGVVPWQGRSCSCCHLLRSNVFTQNSVEYYGIVGTPYVLSCPQTAVKKSHGFSSRNSK
jgi:hypothetical protein